jgi:hypothetical protein
VLLRRRRGVAVGIAVLRWRRLRLRIIGAAASAVGRVVRVLPLHKPHAGAISVGVL